jgi:hypothetical protein
MDGSEINNPEEKSLSGVETNENNSSGASARSKSTVASATEAIECFD